MAVGNLFVGVVSYCHFDTWGEIVHHLSYNSPNSKWLGDSWHSEDKLMQQLKSRERKGESIYAL